MYDRFFFVKIWAFLCETSSVETSWTSWDDAWDTIQNVVIDERSFLHFAVVFVINDSQEELIKVALLFAFCLHRLQSKTSNKIVKSIAGVFQGEWELSTCSYRVILWGSLLLRHNCQHIESNQNWLFRVFSGRRRRKVSRSRSEFMEIWSEQVAICDNETRDNETRYCEDSYEISRPQ